MRMAISRKRASVLIGLVKYLSMPIRKPLSSSSMIDRITIGMFVVSGSFFSTAATSNPFIPGIITSSRIKSGLLFLTLLMASIPSTASVTAYPADSNSCFKSMRILASSSTTKTFFCPTVSLCKLGATCFVICLTRLSTSILFM